MRPLAIQQGPNSQEFLGPLLGRSFGGAEALDSAANFSAHDSQRSAPSGFSLPHFSHNMAFTPNMAGTETGRYGTKGAGSSSVSE